MMPARPQRSEVVVAAFDLDGTLTHGGSVASWLRTIAGTKPTAKAMLRNLAPLGFAALRGGSAADSAKEELFSELLQGRPFQVVKAQSESFAHRHVAKELRTEVKARLDYHVAAGHHVVIVSASPELYVNEVGKLLGAHGVVATRLALDSSGYLTGRYEGKNCRGTEKFSRTTSWMRSNGLLGSSEQMPVLWAYGNSRGDKRLLQAANFPVSCARLGRLSRLSHFPSLAEVIAAPAEGGR
jgi:phosphatidylglycerophosphatase C